MYTPRSASSMSGPDGEQGREGELAGEAGPLGVYRERLRALVREHPVSSLLVAVLAGYLVGRLVRA